jgi:dephospho-CoA kinase
VALDFKNWVLQQKNYLIFKETALLFELKLNLQCYKSLLVTADDNIRAKRVMDRDGKTYREVKSIMEKQMSEKEKIRFADYVIYNNTDLQDLEKQTEEIVLSIS